MYSYSYVESSLLDVDLIFRYCTLQAYTPENQDDVCNLAWFMIHDDGKTTGTSSTYFIYQLQYI